MRVFTNFIYGILLIIVAYFIVMTLYSVYYTPGVSTIYNSPQAQQLFPQAKNKLYPTWGYNKAGMYDGQPFKFGPGQFWPESGKGFIPNKFGSPGPSPTGGMRPTFSIPAETTIGYWGFTPKSEKHVDLDIYDNSSQHVEYITPIGYWGN